MHRFYVPGSRRIGGRFVWLARAPGPYDDGGTLAEPTVIRGVAIPAGAEIFVDCDFADIRVRLHAPLTVRGVPLGNGVELQFPARVWLPPIIPLAAIPIVIVILPWLIWRARRDAREIRVHRDGKWLFSIALDGSTQPPA